MPRTSTFALTNATLAYALSIADKGLQRALKDDPDLALGLNVYNGAVTFPAVADCFGMECFNPGL